MADIWDKKKRSDVMSLIRSRGNKDTELKLATILRTNAITGWRRHQTLPGRPDFVFRNARLAVFVDGCFWHGCPTHGRMPSSNRAYWHPKIARNKARDKLVTATLRKRGWRVLRLWEHSLKRPDRVAAMVHAVLQ